VTLAEGTSVGAMSMVTKSTEPWSIYFGVPAKKIKNRRNDLLALEQQYLSEGI
jgi:galactoside O-acetyltransferase